MFRQPRGLSGFTHARSVSPALMSSESLSATSMMSSMPSKRMPCPNRPVVRTGPLSAPSLWNGVASTAVPAPGASSKPYAARSPYRSTVTVAAQDLLAPCASVAVRVTGVWPRRNRPAGSCTSVNASPSASNDPASTDAAAVESAAATTVTFRHSALGAPLILIAADADPG